MIGVYLCEDHGRAGLADVCIHIAEAVSSRSPTPDVVSVKFQMGNFGNQREAAVILVLNYCRLCAVDHGFPTQDCELPGEAWEVVSKRGQFTGVCGACLKVATS